MSAELLVTLIIVTLAGLLWHYADKSEREDDGILYGEVICPHCQTKGQVWIKARLGKKGISGAKATGAILTGGLSLLGTGLSKTGIVKTAKCKNCDVTWTIE